MGRSFSEIMSSLRHERGLSQRTVAADLHISQALLSHYENGARRTGSPVYMPGLRILQCVGGLFIGQTEERNSAHRERAALAELAPNFAAWQISHRA
jgi:transcriptional regulator with XRE-family HTH domain